MMIYNAFLQVGLCRASGSFVELKNRIILGSLLMPVLGFITFLVIRHASGRTAKARFFTVVLSLYLALLSFLMAVFHSRVHGVHAAVVLLSIFLAVATRRGVRHAATGLIGQARRLPLALRCHALFALTVPIFFVVFLCEINDQWDVYEADGPYYGQFARNILRYDLAYTCLLRTHGTGDRAAPKRSKTHNLRHPNGYIVYLTAWYLIVGSDPSRPTQRALPLLSNFLFLLMLYRFILKKSGSRSVAACTGLIYILIPIASTFAGKIHQLSMMHTLLLLGIISYDGALLGSKRALRYMLVFCALSLLTDWYAAFFWPLVWADYLVRYVRDSSRFHARLLYLLPAVCALAGAAIFGHMLLGKISFGTFEYVAKLRFDSNSVKQFTMENFNATLVRYLVRDYTGVVYQAGAVWPLLFAVRAARRRIDALDVYTLICLVYAIVNVYLFKKIFIHYFEVIHFLPYAVLAGGAVVRYAHPLTRRLGRSRGALMAAAVALSMLPGSVDGIRYYRLRHSGSYTDGYAEAAEFIRRRIRRHETVVTNRIFNIYTNERHIIGNRLVKCDTVKCFKKTKRNEDPAFAILFEKDSNARLFQYVLRQGAVHLFHDRVVVVALKAAPNLLDRLPADRQEGAGPGDPLTEEVRLLEADLPRHVPLKRASFRQTYFTSLNPDKFVSRRAPVLDIDYTYRKIRKGDAPEQRDEKHRDKGLHTEIRDAAGQVVATAPHALTNTFYTPRYWPGNRAVHETVPIRLAPDLPPGVYHAYACSPSAEIRVGRFFLGRRTEEIRAHVADDTPNIPIDRPLSDDLRFVGATLRDRVLSPGETLRIDTYYKTSRKSRDVVSPVIRIRDLRDGDLTVPVHPDPLPLLEPDTIYRYPARIDIPPFALGGVKKVSLEAKGRTVELGAVEIASPRRGRDILADETDTSHRFAGSSEQRRSDIVAKKETIEIRFKAKRHGPVRLLLDAEYPDKPAGYRVVVDLPKSRHNGSRRQRVQSDIVEKPLLSEKRYRREIVIPAQLIGRGRHRVTLEPLRPGRIDQPYPGWRNAMLKLFSPTLDWLLRRDLSGKLPPFSYIAVDE